ncbi:MAG: hypothetical protein Q9208_007557 [Pyrenodesmia sp. 3 TL-2023]
MMEPFSMLSKPGGMAAKEFLWINYLSANYHLALLQALTSGHLFMLGSSALYAGVLSASPLAAEVIGIYQSIYPIDIDTHNALAGPALWIHPIIARILQGILAFACFMLVGVWYLLRKQPTRVYSDPTSISGIACLIHHPAIVHDLAVHHQDVKESTLLQHLAGKRYRLGFYQSHNGTERYGIIPADNDMSIRCTRYVGVSSSTSPTPSTKRHGTAQILLNWILVLTAIGVTILIAVYFTRNDDTRFERFMDAQNFGPRFLFTCIGMVIKSQWTRLERRAVILEPFRRLHKGTTPADQTVLAPRTLVPVSTLFAAIRHRKFYNALLAVTALLAEVLIIILPSIPFDPSQTWEAWQISNYIAFAILGFMLLVMVAVWLRKEVPLPREPNTLGAMAMYVAGSQMAEEVAQLGVMTDKEMKDEIKKWGRGYALKRVGTLDAGKRWVVDFDDRIGGVQFLCVLLLTVQHAFQQIFRDV